MENLAEAMAQKGDSTKEKMIKALREREAQRNSAEKSDTFKTNYAPVVLLW